MILIAIDPGSSGGIAVRYPFGNVEAKPMPDTEGDIVNLLSDIKAAYPSDARFGCYIEKVGGFVGHTTITKYTICQKCHSPVTYYEQQGNPGSAMFSFGSNVGLLKGIIMTLKIPLREITPQMWQKACCLGTRGSDSKTDWKNKIKGFVQKTYPQIKVTLKTSDALAILWVATGIEGLNF